MIRLIPPESVRRLEPAAAARSRRSVLAAVGTAALALLPGCASWSGRHADDEDPPAHDPALDPPTVALPDVPAFSDARETTTVPSGWRPLIIHPRKKRTVYSITRQAGRTVLKAEALHSASGLIARLDCAPQGRPWLDWQWRADNSVDGADPGERGIDDAPVRVIVGFDGDRSALPLRDRLFMEQARLLSGRDLPFATLVYLWDDRRPAGAILTSPHTPRIRKIVVAGGPGQLGRWQAFRRNLVEDYHTAFGGSPGRIVGIGVMTDSDNTRQRVTAFYGDIRLSAG